MVGLNREHGLHVGFQFLPSRVVEAGLPRTGFAAQFVGVFFQLGFHLLQVLPMRFEGFFLRRRGQFEHWAKIALAVAVVLAGVEEGEHLVILALREWVELVVVTLRATQRDAEEHRRRRVDAVEHGLNAELLGVNAAFLIDLRVAMEPGRDLLPDGRVGQQIAGELPDGKLIEGQVLIEGVDDPVAVFPDGPRRVEGITVRVGVTGRVQPPAGPTFAVMGRGEQPIHQPLEGVRTSVVEKRVHLFRPGGKTDQIEAQPANQRDAVSFRRRRDSLLLQPGEDKSVDGTPHPLLVLHVRRRDALRRHERPVDVALGLFVCRCRSALVDPLLDECNLNITQRRFLVRHPRYFRVNALYGLDDQALCAPAPLECRAAFTALQRGRGRVQSKLAFLLGRSMAFVATFSEQRLHLEDVIHRRGAS